MSSGITWGIVLDGYRGAHPGVMVTFYFLSPSDVLQVPEALSWRVVMFSSAAMVVLVFLPSEVAQEGVLMCGECLC